MVFPESAHELVKTEDSKMALLHPYMDICNN